MGMTILVAHPSSAHGSSTATATQAETVSKQPGVSVVVVAGAEQVVDATQSYGVNNPGRASQLRSWYIDCDSDAGRDRQQAAITSVEFSSYMCNLRP